MEPCALRTTRKITTVTSFFLQWRHRNRPVVSMPPVWCRSEPPSRRQAVTCGNNDGVKQADYCWEFVASYFWSSFDRATNALADKGSNRVKRAMRIACSRCPKSSDTAKHPEGLMAMHAMPKNVNNLVTYFQ